MDRRRDGRELVEVADDDDLDAAEPVCTSKFYGAESSRRPPRHRRDACSMVARDALVDFHTAPRRRDVLHRHPQVLLELAAPVVVRQLA